MGWAHICMNQKIERVIRFWLRDILSMESPCIIPGGCVQLVRNVNLELGSLLIRETST